MSFTKGKKIILVIAAVLFFGTLFTWMVMLLWNWLMPDIFGITVITFWQALGILVLSKILFGGWMQKKHRSHCYYSRSKWGSMSSDEKKSFKAKFMAKWAHCHYEEGDSPKAPAEKE